MTLPYLRSAGKPFALSPHVSSPSIGRWSEVLSPIFRVNTIEIQ